ncbi:hypothetical protein SAMN06265360_10658 [Haloechinothrix alba]|uniref:Uncharacterized protein n=1 Tax=Haloechinothrix alba TaxID=664784 RepID=A0A238WDM4_9PSEU|nr:hypothetical protein [Haloechinothrix alba]SNR44538.1 hypothetical protein SAMN06265360_10658 [Haloechinothrix alba]
MTWFKVDDGLALHHKTVRAGNAAMGLWVRAGSYASQHLTDGWVPDEIVRTLGTRAQARRLVAAGLWLEDEGGYWFHEWHENGQPTREGELARRSNGAARQQKHREKSRRSANVDQPSNGPGSNEDSPPVEQQPKNNPPDSEESQVTKDSNALPLEVRNAPPDPARPDPVLPSGSTEGGTRAARPRATRIPDDFTVTDDMIAWARTNTPDVGRIETDKFIDYWRAKAGKDATKVDWVSTWRNWMRKAQQDVENRRSRPAARPGKPTQDEKIRNFLGATGTDDPPPPLYALPGGES